MKKQLRLINTVALVIIYGLFFAPQISSGHPTGSQNIVLTEASPEKDKNTTLDSGILRANIALAEYEKNPAERKRGCNCGDEIDKYTGGKHVQWCTAFASWVAKEAGTPIAGDSEKEKWRIFNSQKMKTILERKKAFYTKQEIMNKIYVPQVGDYVISWRGNNSQDLGHVDIIINLNSDGTADLIGGNIDDTIVYRKSYPYANSYGFQGVGRP